ncbi:hypothetical protein PoB_002378800 [Plakobranchus ocellatus]|uniref:Uncharacterized protein n=1 Tax=Plakobranchus ocellatus TaxID=259542 RepID=A0AAV3ZS73_9GAST|nr:hypothetical protein PoB_002378800 [Plakobranchus ocellatus]
MASTKRTCDRLKDVTGPVKVKSEETGTNDDEGQIKSCPNDEDWSECGKLRQAAGESIRSLVLSSSASSLSKTWPDSGELRDNDDHDDDDDVDYDDSGGGGDGDAAAAAAAAADDDDDDNYDNDAKGDGDTNGDGDTDDTVKLLIEERMVSVLLMLALR